MINTWKKKVRFDARDSFLPDPIDYADFHVNLGTRTSEIRKRIQQGHYVPASPVRYRVEKSRGLCRLMVSVEPADMLILQCLSDVLYFQIKKQAPSPNAFFEPKDHSFSALKGIEPEYGTFASWKNFQKEILGFARSNRFLIVTHIANYYDFIDFIQLRNVIAAQKRVNEALLDFLIYLLRGLSWQPDFMPPRATGLPQIDMDAPRLLAYAYLFDLDLFMESTSRRNYARFMDDIDAGVGSIAEAKSTLRDIDLVLQSKNLRLNSGKTQILTSAQAERHFRVRHNARVNSLEEEIGRAAGKGGRATRLAERLGRVVGSMLGKGQFDDGNGEKILKRLVNLCTRYGGKIPVSAFEECIFRRPNMREICFRNTSHTGWGSDQFAVVTEYLRLGLACDDAFQMFLCRSIVAGQILYDGTEKESLKNLMASLDVNSVSGVYSKLWLLSRFGKPNTLIRFLKSGVIQALPSRALSRLMGGMIPRFYAHPSDMPILSDLVAAAPSAGGQEVLSFHTQLRDTSPALVKLYPTLKVQNSSLPLRCAHSKYLMIASALQNKSLQPEQKNTIQNAHRRILMEPSYAGGGVL